ncbi:Mor transcription activator family protein [Burkholderia cepacia]|uniref:Mor transcription activator family protein n=1 Tax=Burkholderia cepacia TaxID=292 RepID=UPI00158C82B7|nr:Mor transcription activator family protein [Burkholderia cepacia]
MNDDLRDVQHLFSPLAKTIVRLIGMEATLTLVEKMGGQKFPIPVRKNRHGEARYEELAEVIGADAASNLCAAFGGEYLEIPILWKAKRELMFRRMRVEFDRITREHSSNYAVAKLAVKFGTTDRQVRRILGTDNDTSTAADDQFSLF